MPDVNDGVKTEVLILRNPLYYKVAAPEAFEIMIKNGSWLPLVFGVLRTVVERHFMELCELNWDYINHESNAPQDYDHFRAVYSKNLNPEQTTFIQAFANELEEELKLAAEEMLNAQESEGDFNE